MLIIFIFLGTLVAGIGSVLLAALISPGSSSRYASNMLGFAAGALLSTAFLHLLPEAFSGAVAAKNLFIALLIGLVFFFVLDKAELWHHGHEHHQDGEPGAVSHRHDKVTAGSWAVLMGDSVHCFGDGLLIAAAFIADLRLGALASLAVLTHEIPHHLGDLAVLKQVSGGQNTSVEKVCLAGSVTALGGLMGYWLVEPLKPWLPYFLTVAASSFIYVALADLIPQLQKHSGPRAAVQHVFWLILGIAVVAAAASFDVD